jgi:hypothetical protein
MVAKSQISYNVYLSKHSLDAHGSTLTLKCHVLFKNTLKQSLVHFHEHNKKPKISKIQKSNENKETKKCRS